MNKRMLYRFLLLPMSRHNFNSQLAMNLKKLISKTALTLAVLSPFSPATAFSQASQGTEPLAIPAPPPITSNSAVEEGWWTSQPKETKLLYTNLTAAALIGVWGLIEWDYGSEGWNKADEGWFEKDSKYGGADKVGHFWSTFAFSDALTGLYKSWGYSSDKANTYAALSAWTVQAAMEIGDATSKSQGFSYEDMVVNTLGALTSVLMENYPELDRKIDFRVEYVFNVAVNGIFDDYSNQYYSMVLKLDGFDVCQDSFLKYLELSAGYYSRGYGEADEEDTRSFYGGISFNFSRLLLENGWEKTGKTLEYIQLPYTVLKASHDLD
ncbi:MAG: YfiM family protein [Proteobacteria bacterium]|nr:YfiM family protein [Pseudomonadota bacterium]